MRKLLLVLAATGVLCADVTLDKTKDYICWWLGKGDWYKPTDSDRKRGSSPLWDFWKNRYERNRTSLHEKFVEACSAKSTYIVTESGVTDIKYKFDVSNIAYQVPIVCGAFAGNANVVACSKS